MRSYFLRYRYINHARNEFIKNQQKQIRLDIARVIRLLLGEGYITTTIATVIGSKITVVTRLYLSLVIVVNVWRHVCVRACLHERKYEHTFA